MTTILLQKHTIIGAYYADTLYRLKKKMKGILAVISHFADKEKNNFFDGTYEEVN